MTATPTFDHRNRESLLELMRPPVDYRLESAIGTSYSVDFVTLTGIMLAFVDAELGDGGQPTIPQQLGAITRLAEKMLLFVNRSSILLSGVGQSSQICAIYDRIFREIYFEDGSFHPKVWVLTYMPRLLPTTVGFRPIYRLLCMSRNATINNSWELAIKLEGQIASRRKRNPIGSGLSEYLARIKTHLKSKEKILDAAIEDLPYVDFELPRPMSERCEFLYQWPNRQSLSSSVPASGKRALLMAPFLSKSFVELAVKRFDEVYLISTRRELDKTLDEALMKQLKDRVFFVDDELSSEVDCRLALHAKLYILEPESGTTVMLGSANASHSAWNNLNCEALLAFSPGWNIRQFLEQFVFQDEKNDILHAWIEHYTLEDWQQKEVETDEERGEQAISRAQKALAGFEFDLHYNQDLETLILKASQDGKQSRLASDTADVGVVAKPMSLVNMGEIESWAGGSLLSAFDAGISYTVRLPELTEFVCFQITHPAVKGAKRFVLKATTHNFADLLDTRDRELLRSQLTAKQFALFLNALLFDSSLHGKRTIDTLLSGGRTHSRSTGGHDFSVCIEDVMQACTEDETRVEEVSKILTAFEGTDADEQEYVSQDFRKFWNEFKTAFVDAVKV